MFASGTIHPSLSEESLLPMPYQKESVHVADIFRPALTLPVASSTRVTQTQAALHLLCCLDSLNRCQQIPKKGIAHQDTKNTLVSHCFTKEDFSVANRFESEYLKI